MNKQEENSKVEIDLNKVKNFKEFITILKVMDLKIFLDKNIVDVEKIKQYLKEEKEWERND